MAALEEAGRRLASHTSAPDLVRVFTTHLEQVRKESVHVTNAHGDYALSIGDYSDTAVDEHPPLLVLPEPHAAIPALDESARYDLDATLLHEGDSWSATEAARSLVTDMVPPVAPGYSLSSITARLLGVTPEVLLSNKHFRSPTTSRFVLLGALNAHLHGLESGQLGGLQRARDMEKVKGAIAGLLQC